MNADCLFSFLSDLLARCSLTLFEWLSWNFRCGLSCEFIRTIAGSLNYQHYFTALITTCQRYRILASPSRKSLANVDLHCRRTVPSLQSFRLWPQARHCATNFWRLLYNKYTRNESVPSPSDPHTVNCYRTVRRPALAPRSSRNEAYAK